MPEHLLAYYREQVFPLLRDVGIQAITPYDVDTPGATLYARAMALIENAGATVADVSGGETAVLFEAQLALTSDPERRGRLAVVGLEAEEFPTLPTSLEAEAYFFRASGLEPIFPGLLVEWLSEIFGPARWRLDAVRQADILAPSPEPEWDVVRAFRELELALVTAIPPERAPWR